MAIFDPLFRLFGRGQRQNQRYDNLSGWAYMVLSNRGKDTFYTQAMLRDQLVSRRVLTRVGEVRRDRFERFMAEKARVLQKKTPNLPITDTGWEAIAEVEYWG